MDRERYSFVWLLGVLFVDVSDPDVAQGLAYNLCVICAAAIGACWNIPDFGSKTKLWQEIGYLCLIVFTALIATGGIVEVLLQFYPNMKAEYVGLLVSFVIGLVGPRWKQVGAWVVSWGLDFLNRLRGK